MLIAAIYARVSTEDQSCTMQLTELRAFAKRMAWKVEEYTEVESSVKPRAVLDRLLNDARLHKFDIVLVWKLDRFGRSVAQLARDIQLLDSSKVRFVCPTQGIDTDQNNPASRLFLHMLAAFAEFERSLIVERTKAGRARYDAEYKAGKIGGTDGKHSRSGKDLAPHRPFRIFDRARAKRLRRSGLSLRAIALKMRIPLSTVADALKPVR